MNVAEAVGPYVLVVDDEAEVCDSLVLGLQREGLDAAGAAGVREALDAAAGRRPDMVVTDIRLADGSGLEMIDALRRQWEDLPVVVITGFGDADTLLEASRRRPVEVLDKPVDLERLCRAVRDELRRQRMYRHVCRRNQRLRNLTRRINRQRKRSAAVLTNTCADLADAYHRLQNEVERRDALIQYQNDLLACDNEDDVFRRLFALFVQRTGPVFGAAMLCDENAELQMVGRFGVPVPDGVNFCRQLADTLVPLALEQPKVRVLDAWDNVHRFPPGLRKMLVGVTVLLVPLMAGEGEMIGLVVLYRKGEQPFTDEDTALATMVGPATSAAAQRV